MANIRFMELANSIEEMLASGVLSLREAHNLKIKTLVKPFSQWPQSAKTYASTRPRDNEGKFLPKPKARKSASKKSELQTLEKARTAFIDTLKFLKNDCRFEALCHEKTAAGKIEEKASSIKGLRYVQMALLIASAASHGLLWGGSFWYISLIPVLTFMYMTLSGWRHSYINTSEAKKHTLTSSRYRSLEDLIQIRLYNAPLTTTKDAMHVSLDEVIKSKNELDEHSPCILSTVRDAVKSDIEVESILNEDPTETKFRVLNSDTSTENEEEEEVLPGLQIKHKTLKR